MFILIFENGNFGCLWRKHCGVQGRNQLRLLVQGRDDGDLDQSVRTKQGEN